MKKIMIVLATSAGLLLSVSNLQAAGVGSLVGGALIEAISKGADLAESIGCAAGGIKAKELKVLQEVTADGKITIGDEAKLNLAVASGLCIKGKAEIVQRIETGDIKLGEKACAAIGVLGQGAC